MTIPSFVKVGLVFVSILLVYRAGVSLGLSILIHSIILAWLAGAGLIPGIYYICSQMIAPKNYLLLLVILLLLFFTEALKVTGRMEQTVGALKSWMKSRNLLISGLPALVGLLPMPGGALFSAPLVESVDSGSHIAPAHKAAINYWFRHIWEYWWPLYPGVILAIRYSDLPSGLFFLIQIPFTFASILGGYYFILRKLRHAPSTAQNGSTLDLRAARSTLGPIALLVVFSVAGSFLLPKAGVPDSLANLIGMLVALILALALVFGSAPKAFLKAMPMFHTSSTWTLMLVILGVLAFSSVLQMPLSENKITLVALMRDEFVAFGIPIIIVIMLIPFISGAVTGIAVGFVGAGFPLVFALLGEHPPLNVVIATTSLAYAFGYLGMILSPVHICFIVTNEYFKARLIHSYRFLWAPSTVILLTSLIVSGAYYLLLK